MKKIFVGGLKVGAVMILCAGLASEARAQGGFLNATVLRLQGSARVSTDHVKWRKLEKGSTIAPRSLIQTGDKTSADILLFESPSAFGDESHSGGDLIRLSPNTVLEITRIDAKRVGGETAEDLQLDLQMGHVTCKAAKLAPGAKYEIKFPRGIVGIRAVGCTMEASGRVWVIGNQKAVVAMAGADGSPMVKVLPPEGEGLPHTGVMFDPESGAVSPFQSNEALMEAPAKAEAPAATAPGASPENPEVKPPTGLHPLRKF